MTLKNIILSQLDTTDPIMQQIKLNSILNPNTTYTAIKTSILLSLKNATTLNLIGINASEKQVLKVLATKHSLHNNNKYSTNNFIQKKKNSNQNQNNFNNNNNNKTIICANCKGDHHVRDCLSVTCSTCGTNFDTPKARSMHYSTAHWQDPKTLKNNFSNSH
jgi:hypothetical protein